MYVRTFRVRNFMIHGDTYIVLQPLTVLVGPNGGGKSALFDAMLNFSMLSRGNLRQAFGPFPYSFRATVYRGARQVARIGYRVSMSRQADDPTWLEYEIDYAQRGMADDKPSFTIYTEKLIKQPEAQVLFDRARPEDHALGASLQLEDDRSVFSALRLRYMTQPDEEVDDLVSYCAVQISRFNKFRLDPVVLAQPSRMPEAAADDSSRTVFPRIGYHGEDLAATLYHLADTSSPDLELIRTQMASIEPEFRDFEFNTVGTDRIAFSAVFSDSRQTVPSVRLSSGTLIYLGLVTLVSTANRPPVLMIEEPENGLTPQAVKAFYKAVRTLSHGNDPERQSQVLISSHSPFVICEAWNGEDRDFIHQVRVVDGRAHIRTFSEVVAQHKIQLGKDQGGNRTHLSLKNAEEIMSGYLS